MTSQPESARSWLLSSPGEVTYRLTFLSETTFRIHALMDDPVTKKVPELMVVADETSFPPPVVSSAPVDGGIRFTTVKAAITLTMQRGRVAVSVDVGADRVLEGWQLVPGDHASTLALRPDEHVYGFGDKRAAVDQRGHVVPMLNKDALDPAPPAQPGEASETNDSYKSVPFYFTSRGYGLFAHDFFPGEFDVGKAAPNELRWKAQGGDLDFYVFAEGRPVDILAQYTRLTGRPALMPRWFFGYHQSRASYAGLEARTVAQTMRQKNLPVDVIYYDDFVDEAATRPFIDELFTQHHVRLTFGGNPFIIDDADLARRMGAAHELLSKPDGSPVIEPAAEMDDDSIKTAYVDWFSKRATADFFEATWGAAMRSGVILGMADFGELDHLKDADKKFWPSLAQPASVTRNIYSLAYADGLIESARKASGGRSTGMIRPGTAGTQRYGWSTTGDSSPTYSNWRAHLRCLLNLSLSGFSNIGYDIGGWDGKADDILYARWFAAGAFNPFMWAHGQGEHEPYAHGQAVEDATRSLLAVRYRLVPYLYSLNDVAHRLGVPMLRAFALSDSADPRSATVDDEFFLGDDVVVAPVTDAHGRDLYLPKGTWYDFFDESPPEPGGRVVSRHDVPLDRIPVFVRAGAVLPLGMPMQYADEKPDAPLIVNLYAFGRDDVATGPRSSAFDLYEDDGVSTRFESGEAARTHLAFTESSAQLDLEMRVDAHGYIPPARPCRVVVHGFGTADPSHVRLDGSDVPRTDWQLSATTLTVSLPTCKSQRVEIVR
jgi:alpha-glucosidase